jgi:Ca2+-binding EF-hand superfamily protein
MLIISDYVTVTEKILARDPMEEIRRAFQLFDDDNTGKISIRNLRRVAKEIGDRLEDDELYVTILFIFTRADDDAAGQTSDDRRV